MRRLSLVADSCYNSEAMTWHVRRHDSVKMTARMIGKLIPIIDELCQASKRCSTFSLPGFFLGSLQFFLTFLRSSVQDGPLPVINGVKTRIHGLING